MDGELSKEEAETIAETFGDKLQAVYDEVHATFGGLRVDLAARPGYSNHQGTFTLTVTAP